MGNRANIWMKSDDREDAGVYFYTHWGADVLPFVLQKALDRGRSRWDDPQYLGRIIFSQMIKGDIDGELGYGISSSIRDGGYRILRVNTDKQEVSVAGRSYPSDEYIEKMSFSFENYIALGKQGLNHIWDVLDEG